MSSQLLDIVVEMVVADCGAELAEVALMPVERTASSKFASFSTRSLILSFLPLFSDISSRFSIATHVLLLACGVFFCLVRVHCTLAVVQFLHGSWRSHLTFDLVNVRLHT